MLDTILEDCQMLRIIADSSTMYSKNDGYDIAALQVTINGRTYAEYEDICPQEFVQLIKQGGIPTSSQPPIGVVEDLFNKYPDDEIINISMADGLSGTYQTALMAKNMLPNNERITVINTKTLCGPHRHLFEFALKQAKDNKPRDYIINKIQALMATEKSFLIPVDFDYLKRGGRLSPFVAKIGKGLHLFPIITPNAEATSLDIVSLKRTFKNALIYIINKLKEHGINQNNIIYVSHALNPKYAKIAVEKLNEEFPGSPIEEFILTPVFITQGGPGCIAIQTIKKEI